MSNLIKKEIKIELLDWNESPLDIIEGTCTGGNLTIDGNSAVRRTCSLSLLVKNKATASADWSISKKIKIYIKINNGEWLKQGLFVITNFSIGENSNGITISLTAQDKMCLLNGTISGSIFAEIDFGNINTYISQSNLLGGLSQENNIQKAELSIFDIIRESVHSFGGEKYENIVIKDIEDGLELLEYRGKDILVQNDAGFLTKAGAESGLYSEIFPYGLYIKKEDGTYEPRYKYENDKTYYIAVAQLNNKEYIYNNLNESLSLFAPDFVLDKAFFDEFLKSSFSHYQRQYGVVYIQENNSYNIAYDTPKSKIYHYTANDNVQCYQYGDTIGYRTTALTYTEKDYVLKPGENIGTLLEKIKKQFGLYEYFYDVDGRFIFQKKQTYLNFGLIDEKEKSLAAEFKDKEKIIGISSNPQIANIKNDFSIWGTTATKTPFHVRIGTAKKPIYYKSYKGIIYTTTEAQISSTPVSSFSELQWLLSSENKTELYFKTPEGEEVSFTPENILKAMSTTIEGLDEGSFLQTFIWILVLMVFIMALLKGVLPNEDNLNFYRKTERVLDYRELIYQMALDYFAYHNEPDFEAVLSCNNDWIKNGKTGYETFYTDLKEFWPKLYNGNVSLEDSTDYILSGDNIGWNKDILNPSNLIFWFELVDGKPEYQIQNIGSRMKAETNEGITAIAYKETPKILFYPSKAETAPEDWKGAKESLKNFTGYTQIQIPNDMLEDFIISPKHYSAMELIESYLYSYQILGETKTVTIIPDYSLQPNTRIKLLGDTYLIKKISYSLAYNSSMSLELVKIYNDLQGEQ